MIALMGHNQHSTLLQETYTSFSTSEIFTYIRSLNQKL